MKKWKILSKKDVSPSHWFPIEQHTVELPNGKIVDDYYITTVGEVAMVLPITKEGKIVLVKQYKHAGQAIFLELPGGFRQTNKTIEESALAELEEETGIKTTLDNLIPLGGITITPTKSNQITYAFLAKDLSFNSQTHFDELEEIEVVLFDPKEVLQMIKEGKINVSDSVTAIMKAYLMFPEIFE